MSLQPTVLESDYTRIVIVDGKERKLGGSRLLNASDIWVRED